MKTKMTPEQLATKERLLKRTKKEMDSLWNDPGFRAEHATWQKGYRAAAEMCAARERAGMTQEALARRLHIPRANVSRMENGQNVTFATFTKYLNGCGFDFSITIFPMKRGLGLATPTRRCEKTARLAASSRPRISERCVT